MPRRRVAAKREILPDPVYHNRLVAKFVNSMMRAGKKSLAEQIFYRSMGIIEGRMKTDALAVFKQALDNVKPVLQVKSRRVGGATYQVPVEVRSDRRLSLAFRWVLTYARQRSERTMEERLAAELIEAANNRGAAVKKKEDTHRMAEANKAFAHYRW
ncbi:MAG: 30S ribosomal protein S7 [candidate division NC10 bacterium]